MLYVYCMQPNMFLFKFPTIGTYADADMAYKSLKEAKKAHANREISFDYNRGSPRQVDRDIR